MKNGEKNTDRPSSAGVGRYRKEWVVAVFSLLMATALPALAAMVAGISVRSGTDGLTEQTTVCLCRHDTEVREELTFGRILARYDDFSTVRRFFFVFYYILVKHRELFHRTTNDAVFG